MGHPFLARTWIATVGPNLMDYELQHSQHFQFRIANSQPDCLPVQQILETTG